MIKVTCPNCGVQILVPPAVQGRWGACFGCGSKLMAPVVSGPQGPEAIEFDAGARISDRYLIEKRIGAGGMGTVYRARDLLMKELVALKFLNPRLLRSQEGIQLFVQEAQVARRLRHDHIVAVHDVTSTPDGILYLSMEYLKGASLRGKVRQHRQDRKLMDVRYAVEIVSQILDALDYAHRLVVHRDIKPENVIILPGEQVKVLDFGLAKAIVEELRASPLDSAETRKIIGTEAYAAPEQKRRHEIDLRADLYAVGLILHELLTLRTPLDDPVRVEQVRSDVAPSILQVLEKSVRETKEDRYINAGAFRDALRRAYESSYRQTPLQIQTSADRKIASTEGMVLLDGGSFMMGSKAAADEKPEFEAYVDPFYIDVQPVTNEQYAKYLEETGANPPRHWGARDFKGNNQPVVGVTWAEAAVYAEWAGKELPSETQWEFAARGKNNRKYPWGNQEPDPHRANYGEYLNMTSFVGMHDDGNTPEGLQDMAGNVYEWTRNWFVPYDPEGNHETTEPSGAPRRVVRGGSWNSHANELRCAFRKGVFPEAQETTIGFRCVLPLRTAESKARE